MSAIVMIPRKMSISFDKTKVTPAVFQQQGWTLRDKNYEKVVSMPLFGKPNANTVGGVPDIGEPTQDDVLSYVNDIMSEGHITPKPLLKAILNGVYLHLNDQHKPTETTSHEAKMGVFFAQNLVNGVPNATFLQYAALTAQPVAAKEFLAKWFDEYSAKQIAATA